MRRLLALLSLLLALVPAASAGELPAPLVVRDVRLAPEADAPRRSIRVRDGRIEAIVDASEGTPVGYRAIDGGGRLALPAFVDAFTQAGLVAPAPVAEQDRPVDPTTGPQIEMREAGRKGVRVSFRAADTLALDAGAREAWREAGFGALCVAPAGELLGGASALASPRELAPRDAVLVPLALWHAAFEASGPGYPSTLMGYHAQLRQLFLDAAWHAELEARRAAGRPGPRPAHDKDLEAARVLVAGSTRLACEAQRSEDVERWLALAAEIGVEIAVVGGRDAWEIAPRIAAEDVPVVLTLDWGEEVRDPDAKAGGKEGAKEGETEREAAEAERWRYEEPLAVRRERRRLWEEGRDSGIRLAEAGVRIAFGSAEGKPAELLQRVRELVAAGLPRESALLALTRGAAEICGAGGRLGALEPGRDASFALWTADPLTSRQAKVAWIVLEGEPYEGRVLRREDELPPDEGVDASGTWELELAGETLSAATLRLTMEKDGRVSGALEYVQPGAREPRRGALEGRVRGARLELEGRVPVGLYESEVTLECTLRGDALEGELEWRWSEGRDATTVRGRRVPEDGSETSEEPR